MKTSGFPHAKMLCFCGGKKEQLQFGCFEMFKKKKTKQNKTLKPQPFPWNFVMLKMNFPYRFVGRGLRFGSKHLSCPNVK